MSRLSYGSFEEILRPYIKPEIIKLDLANILFTAPVDQELKEASEVDSPTVTRVCTGQRPLPPRLRAYYAKPDALERIVAVFSNDIVSRIQEIDKAALVHEMLTLIQGDEVMPQEAKAAFEASSRNESLSTFLAKVYLYAVTRKDPPEKITNLPRQNQFFCGREDLLAVIFARYAEGAHMQGLYGMGGVGKTQLALQYAYTHFDEYEMIWWVNAENKATLQSGIAKFLSELKRLPKGKNDDDIRKTFLRYLNKHDDWLLIYDNAEYGTAEEYEALLSYVPQHPQGHILLTTRCTNIFENAAHIEIQVFCKNEAVDFLQHRSCLEDRENASRVAEQLGYLPLALEYAAAYIRETPGIDYVDYAEKLEKYSVKVLDRKVGHLTYKLTVREAFHVTLDKILENAFENPISKSAEQLLNICAYLAPDNIEIDLFATYGASLPEPVRSTLKHELDKDELIRKLTKYSLVQADQNTISMHRLLQEILRDEINFDDQMTWINYSLVVFRTLRRKFGNATLRTSRPILTPLAVHMNTLLHRYIQNIAPHSRKLFNVDEISEEYLFWMGYALPSIDDIHGSELAEIIIKDQSILQTAINFFSKMPSDKNIYLARTLLLSGNSYGAAADWPNAIKQYTRAVNIAINVIDEIPNRSGRYRYETAQIAADVCRIVCEFAIGMNLSTLAWSSYVCLQRNIQTLIKCTNLDYLAFNDEYLLHKLSGGIIYTNSDLLHDVVTYAHETSWMIANYTKRAFAIRIEIPKRFCNLFQDIAPFSCNHIAFYLPDPDCNLPTGNVDQFDILLEKCKNKHSARILNKSWVTLAFPENVNTGDAMMSFLETIDVDMLSIPAKKSFYSVTYMLAMHSNDIERMRKYANKLRYLSK